MGLFSLLAPSESSWAVVRFVKSIVCVSCKKSDEAKDKIDDGKKV